MSFGRIQTLVLDWTGKRHEEEKNDFLTLAASQISEQMTDLWMNCMKSNETDSNNQHEKQHKQFKFLTLGSFSSSLVSSRRTLPIRFSQLSLDIVITSLSFCNSASYKMAQNKQY